MLRKIGKKKTLIAALAVILIAALLIALLPSRKADTSSVNVVEELLSTKAEYGTVNTVFTSGGAISDSGTESIALAGAVKLRSWEVSEGDYVKAGDLLATVDRSSVLQAISELDELMQELDAAIESSRSDTVSSVLYSPIDGTVTKVYAESGADVEDTVYNNGALIVLTDSGGREVNVVGYTGTVYAVYVSEGNTVSAGQSLIYLSDTEYTGEYERLLSQRRKLEVQMQALFAAYERGGVYAESSGRVTGLNEDIISSTGGSTGTGTHLAARLLGSLQRLNAIIIEPVSEGESESEGGTTEPGGSEEPTNPDPVEPDPEPGDSKVTEKFGKVTAVDTEAGTVTVQLTDGSSLTLTAAELEALGASQIKAGDILALGYDESGALVSVTVYSNGGGQDDPTGGGEMPDGMDGSMGGGGMTGGDAAAVDDTPKDYVMDETELCTLTDYDTAEITLTVDELDIARLSIGQAVTVTLDALPGQSFDGEITEIDPNGENGGGSTKYSVTVTLPRTEDMLTGMNAAVRVQLAENDDLLLIPLAAVQEDADGIYVCTGYDKKSDEPTKPVAITTGLSDGENVEVLSGLSEGDSVYYRYADTLEYSFVR